MTCTVLKCWRACASTSLTESWQLSVITSTWPTTSFLINLRISRHVLGWSRSWRWFHWQMVLSTSEGEAENSTINNIDSANSLCLSTCVHLEPSQYSISAEHILCWVFANSTQFSKQLISGKLQNKAKLRLSTAIYMYGHDTISFCAENITKQLNVHKLFFSG